MRLEYRDGLIAFPLHWQVPAATEKAAYESITVSPHPLPFEYIGFPWATIIDGLRGDAVSVPQILVALKRASKLPPKTARRVTVAQHIHAMEFVELFKACGITDVFWPHATHDQHEVDGIRLHPFPLFPAQTPVAAPMNGPVLPRRYLGNFIGAYDPKFYLSNVREVIFNDPNKLGDLLIIKRGAWHFNRVVYEEQIQGQRADEQRLQLERRYTDEYLNAIRESWFTLCPTGSGPNSIRVFESLCLGSIPIVLTRNLRLPGPQTLWDRAAIIEEDSPDGYSRSIDLARSLDFEQRVSMIKSGQLLLRIVEPLAYGEFIVETMAELASPSDLNTEVSQRQVALGTNVQELSTTTSNPSYGAIHKIGGL